MSSARWGKVMKRDRFRVAAELAIDEGDRERHAAAERLASQFLAGSGDFDPRALERLGEGGLATFLAGLGSQNPLPNWHVSDPAAKRQSLPAVTSTTTRGWAHLRQREPQRLILAIASGLAAGLTVAVFGSVIIQFLE